MAKIILSASLLASAALSMALFMNLRRTDHPGRVTFVSSSRPDPFLWIVFDPGPETDRIPLGRNRGYWIEGRPPDGLCTEVSRGDRLVYRVEVFRLPMLGWDTGRIEYRIQRGSETRCFSETSPLRLRGTLGAIGAAPFALGSAAVLVMAILAGASRRIQGTPRDA